jgi:prepilin-type N-terminal cleavage/methylation domain-containing protein/prepilin-type processing-associated H-X9-DG protein
MRQHESSTSGYTLIELLVVIVVIGLLTAIILTTMFNTANVPNPRFPDCASDDYTDLHGGQLHNGVFSASSRHPGGVDVAMMDGSVRFVKDGVTLPVWRALSTRNRGEAVDGGAY